MVIASFEFTVWFTSFVLQHLENILDFYATRKKIETEMIILL